MAQAGGFFGWSLLPQVFDPVPRWVAWVGMLREQLEAL